MPELPDVEAQQIKIRQLLNMKIVNCYIYDKRIVQDTVEYFIDTVKGNSFHETKRHGKHLFIALYPIRKWVTIHFGMSGDLIISSENIPSSKFQRLKFQYDINKSLIYTDQRVFGRISLIDSPEIYIIEHQLGPDALQIDWTVFYNTVHSQSAAIKTVLMDQHRIAGIGNIYTDEILFQSKIHPSFIAAELPESTLNTIFSNMYEVLLTAIDCITKGEPFPNYFIIPHRRKYEKCPRCGHILSHIKLASRTTWFCNSCQSK